jgi:Mrp family chromosome partitioning ATPase
MVERLKIAIEKARASRAVAGSDGALPPWQVPDAPVNPPDRGRAGGEAAGDARDHPRGAPGARPARAPAADPWLALGEIGLDPRVLARERIVTRDKTDPAHVPFDALRTRLLKALHDNRWSRVAITSPTKGCGKTMVACNLAFSLARQPETRCMLIDLDLRMPQIAERLGQRDAYAIEPFLLGEVPARDYLRRAGGNLAIGFNTARVWNAAELVQGRRVAATLAGAWDLYRPHVVIFDLPPMLTSDDVLAFLPNVDGLLLVAAGGQTTAREIEECERLMAEHTNFLGVVLNKAEDGGGTSPYRYEEA